MEYDNPKFPNGLIAYQKHPNAADFVLCNLVIKKQELIAWLNKHVEGDQVRLSVLKKKNDSEKAYAQVREPGYNQNNQTSSGTYNNSQSGSYNQNTFNQNNNFSGPNGELTEEDIPF